MAQHQSYCLHVAITGDHVGFNGLVRKERQHAHKFANLVEAEIGLILLKMLNCCLKLGRLDPNEAIRSREFQVFKHIFHSHGWHAAVCVAHIISYNVFI